MAPVLKKIKVILGLVLCVVGIAGTLLPVIPGVPIILAGITLMGSDHPIVRNIKGRWQRWFERHRSQRP